MTPKISERTLRKWRKEALELDKSLKGYDNPAEFTNSRRMMSNQILQMTQELLDQHLIKRR